MPFITPSYAPIPKEIKRNPRSFGLTSNDLHEVQFCNKTALHGGGVMLDDKQLDRYYKTIETIKGFYTEKNKKAEGK